MCNMCFDNKMKKMWLLFEFEICSYFGKVVKRLMKCVLECGIWYWIKSEIEDFILLDKLMFK